MITVTAILRQPNGERPPLYYLYTRRAPDAAEQMQPIDGDTYYDLWYAYHTRAAHIDGGLVAFDPDRPIEWRDVMNEER